MCQNYGAHGILCNKCCVKQKNVVWLATVSVKGVQKVRSTLSEVFKCMFCVGRPRTSGRSNQGTIIKNIFSASTGPGIKWNQHHLKTKLFCFLSDPYNQMESPPCENKMFLRRRISRRIIKNALQNLIMIWLKRFYLQETKITQNYFHKRNNEKECSK